MSKFLSRRSLFSLLLVFSLMVLAFCEMPFSGSANVAASSAQILAIPDLGIGASLHGARPFPVNNPWNQDISRYPVHPNSANLVSSIGNGVGLHPDFGTVWQGAPIGIPYVVVSGSQPLVPINFTDYGDESDAGPYPVPANAPIEGGTGSDGDRHVLVVDRDNWKLYEMFYSFPINNGARWDASGGAVFDLNSNKLRPETWTSADAAGLPIFPGLVRYDEVIEQAEIKHAIRFTAVRTRKAYVYPARHYASNITDLNVPPMGMRFRLKSSFNIAPYSANVRVILRAMQKYGLILADNGSNWYVSGAPDSRWNDSELAALSQVKGSDFEAVQTPNHLLMPVSDFDGDGRTDVSVFRPSNGVWYITQSSNNAFRATQFGISTDKPTPGDYDGDGKTDVAVYRDGLWYILQSGNNSVRVEQFGVANDDPTSADYDGDGKTDLAVYRQGVWYIKRTTNNSMRVQQFGVADDKTVTGDYDGDGLSDIAVWRPSTGVWYIFQSTNNQLRAQSFGLNGDLPVVGDYDADGKTDVAVYRPSSGVWYVMQSANNAFKATQFGVNSDRPAPGDYDGDNRSDLVVYRPGTGVWYMMRSFDNSFSAMQFGLNGDVPVPSAYVP